MPVNRQSGFAVMVLSLMLLSACAGLPTRTEAPRVSLVNLQLLGAELLEQRYGMTLRVQNPNDFPLRIRGVDFHLEVNGEHFADGVGNQALDIPAFGEARMELQVSSNLWRLLQQIRDMGEGRRQELSYRVHGRISLSGALGRIPFENKGSIPLDLGASRGGV